jgi:hypothetical protein
MGSSVIGRQSSGLRVLAAAVVGVAVVLGSAFLWIGLPLLGFWLLGELTTSGEGFMLTALGGIPLAMVVFGWLLYRLNRVYEGLREPRHAESRRSAWLVSSSDERARSRRARAPRTLIDVAMTASAIAAMLLLAYWFFFVAETPLVTPA